jgi:conjugal transfer pilus assembly protein TraB
MASIQPVDGPESRSLSPKKKQLIIFGGGVAVIAAFVLVAAWLAQPKSHKANVNTPADKTEFVSTTIVPGSQVDQKDVWKATESSKIEALNQDMASMKAKLEQQDKAGGNSAYKNPNGSVSNANLGMAANNPWLPTNLPPPPPPPQPSLAIKAPPVTLNSGAHGGTHLPSQAGGGSTQNGQVTQPAAVTTFSLEIGSAPADSKSAASSSTHTDDNQTRPATGNDSSSGNNHDSKAKDYLPAGTFMQAIMLSGMEAPTGGQAQSNPIPVLLRVVNNAQLPNFFRSKIKSCFITGNGFGDISSERAYIRTDRLSCVDEDGGVLDVGIKGYVSGEDGKAGMHGHLITKQGKALANAFMIGLGSGIGQAFQQGAMTNMTSQFGTVSTINPSQEMQAGIGMGIGTAMDRLAKYYIDLANKLFPVVEVDAGRVVDVVLTKGVSIERR